MTSETLAKTPLHALHLELGARMVAFAAYAMPGQYTPRTWNLARAWCPSPATTCRCNTRSA